jgi:Flp pilus assembly protein TadG
MLLLLLMVGLCIDVSRLYAVRAELQNAADAAALTAARELNQGTGGIADAYNQAKNVIANTEGFGKANVSILTVEFAKNLDGTYMDKADITPAIAANIRFVRVTTQTVSTEMLFTSIALGPTRTEQATAVAGMSVGVNAICDFFPAAVALADPSPTPGTLMNLTFNQGTGNSAVIADKQYIILEVPDITGNGTGETAQLTAGLPNYCKKLGDNINMTPSSNQNNGPRNSGDGMNTRFNVYANGYGNALTPSTFPPDSNVMENISAYDYKNRISVTPPNPNAPGQDDRRLLIVPIILPNGPPPLQPSYPAYTTNIQAWGIFFLRSKVPTPNGNCSNTPGCGSIPVEYIGRANTGNASGSPANSSLTLPVLYR